MDRIALDPKTLKVLAAETRVRIMKMLDRRAMTQSEIAGELRMSLPTIGEHLRALEDAGLVEREQTERKWKYYSLTGKARILLHPNTTTIWFVLGLFLFSALAFVWNAIKYFSPVAPVEAKMALAQEAETLAVPAMADSGAVIAGQSPFFLVVSGIVVIVLLGMLVWLLFRHGWLGKSLTNKKNI
jgi:DNA-binding transcriptional ArsR family regulator